MRRLLVVLLLLLTSVSLFATSWIRVEEIDEFGDPTGVMYLRLNDYKTGTYKNRYTSGSLNWNLKIDNDSGEVTFLLQEDGVDKDLTTTIGTTNYVGSSTKYTLAFKDLQGNKYTLEGGKVEVSSAFYWQEIHFAHDLKNFLLKNSIVEIVITSSYGSYSLGYIDFSDIDPSLLQHTYAIGDEGPAGGIIFYDCDADNDTGNADNLTSSTCGWRYLEVAQEDLGTYLFGYYRPNGSNTVIGTSTDIGTGAANTQELISAMGDAAYSKNSGTKQTSEYAAKVCADYSITHDGILYDDWFLPSRDELNLLYTVLQEKGLGNFERNAYWSSSEYNSGNSWLQYFYSGYQYAYVLSNKHYVRPIRAF